MLASDTCMTDSIMQLLDFIKSYPRLFVLTGAGCSTESGIPDYRDVLGRWKHSTPIQYQEFIGNPQVRRRYWARSMLGWPRVARAEPNSAHTALAQLEAAGWIHQLVTQNVDGLHQKAGSRRVIDLHGRLDMVGCLGCDKRIPRALVQDWLETMNPDFCGLEAVDAPDGDAKLDSVNLNRFQLPECSDCGGIWKPKVVFFGENVPRPRVARAFERLQEADALLVVGSSLTVYSGYRFCRAAGQQGKPTAVVNLGRTRADQEVTLKVQSSCSAALQALTAALL